MKVEISAGQIELIEQLQQEEHAMLQRVKDSCAEKMTLILKSILAGKDMKGSYEIVGLSKEPPALELAENG